MSDGTKKTLCVYCGKSATRMNSAGQPTCKKHRKKEPKEMSCPECGMPMDIREGKYGYFWGCQGFPACDKTLSIKQSLKMEKFKEEDEE